MAQRATTAALWMWLPPLNAQSFWRYRRRQVLLQFGASYAATMLERYVNRDGIEFVSPSNVLIGGTRPDNGSAANLAAQI